MNLLLLWGLLWTNAMAAAPAAAPPPAPALPAIEEPPLPNFSELVDYRAWYDKQIAVPAGENALDMYGIFLYARKDSPNANIAPSPDSPAGQQLRALMGRGRPWRTPKNQEIAIWAADVESRFGRAFVEGGMRPRFAPRPQPGITLLADLSPPRLTNGRVIGQMFLVRAWLISKKTIYTDRFVQAIKSNLQLATHMTSDPTLEAQLFAIGHRELIYKQIRHALRSTLFRAKVFKKILDVLDTTDATPVPQLYARELHFAEARDLQLLQHFCKIFSANAEPGIAPQIRANIVEGYYSSRYANINRRPPHVSDLFEADPVALASLIHDYYDGLRRILMSPNVPELRKKLAALHDRTFGKNPTLAAIVVPLDLSVESVFRTEARRRMMYVFLNMAIQFKKTNKWPLSLADLDQKRISHHRIDPFSGKDFLLAPIQTRVTLYSIGPDGVDDKNHKSKDVGYWAFVRRDETVIEKDKNLTPATAPEKTVEPRTSGSGS